jgi:hypothetical protein
VNGIIHLRCFNHAGREAVARCLECGRTFCRECIAEHEGRVVCAHCLAILVKESTKKLSVTAAVIGGAWRFMGFFVLWALFYYMGKALLWLPSSFHESVFWKNF